MAASVKDNLHAEIKRSYTKSWKYYVKVKNEHGDELAYGVSNWLIAAVWHAYALLYVERRKLKNSDKEGPTWTIR